MYDLDQHPWEDFVIQDLILVISHQDESSVTVEELVLIGNDDI